MIEAARSTKPIPHLEWLQLPEDLPCSPLFEIYEISSTDRRVGLRGHRGLLAAKDIPAGTCLGPYRCLALLQSTMDWYSRHLPPHWKDAVKGGSNPTAIWKYLVDIYAVDISVEVNGTEHRIAVSAFGYGNKTALVNDSHIEPLRNCTSPRCAQVVGEQNADLIPVFVCGFPFLFLFSVEDIKAGEELLYEYGCGYWECIKDMKRGLDERDQQIVESFMHYEATETYNRSKAETYSTGSIHTAESLVVSSPSPPLGVPLFWGNSAMSSHILGEKIEKIERSKSIVHREEQDLQQEAAQLRVGLTHFGRRHDRLQLLRQQIRTMEQEYMERAGKVWVDEPS